MERVRCVGNDHPLRSTSTSTSISQSSSSIAGRAATTDFSSSRSSNVSHSHSHNLKLKEEEDEDNYIYRTPSRLSDAASLIQRAAKTALLDEATPTSPYEDTPASSSSSHIIRNNMRSLETPSLPAIPDEQDRKRFIGCLAAVLSSMYDYESYELSSPSRIENETTNSNPNNNNNNNNNDSNNINEVLNNNDVSGFFDFYESDDDDDDDDDDDHDHDDESIDVLPSQRNNNGNNNNNNRKIRTEDNDNNNNNNNRSLLSKASSTDTTDNFYSRRCQSFDSMGGIYYDCYNNIDGKRINNNSTVVNENDKVNE